MNDRTCCPVFKADEWDGLVRRFDHLHFIKGSVACFWYIPLNFGAMIRRKKRAIEEHGAVIVDNICLSDHLSPWRMEVLIAIDKNNEELGTFTLEGEYLSAVYEGPHAKTSEFAKDFARMVQERGATIKRHLMYYPLCPRCAKAQGKNYSVMIGSPVK